MRASLRVAALLLTILGGVPALLAQDRRDTAVRDALLAQLFGPGGCTDLGSQREIDDPFFPAVRIVEGRCVAEHGDEARAFIAIDSAGVIFLLDSPSGFNFLTRRHPVSSLDSSNAVEYAERVARLSRSRLPRLQLVGQPGEIPSGVWQAVGLSPGQLLPPGLQNWQASSGVAHVSLLAYGPDEIVTRVYLIHTPTGTVFEREREDHWPRAE